MLIVIFIVVSLEYLLSVAVQERRLLKLTIDLLLHDICESLLHMNVDLFEKWSHRLKEWIFFDGPSPRQPLFFLA